MSKQTVGYNETGLRMMHRGRTFPTHFGKRLHARPAGMLQALNHAHIHRAQVTYAEDTHAKNAADEHSGYSYRCWQKPRKIWSC